MDYDIVEAFNRIENELTRSMIRNLDHHRAQELEEGYDWSQWQVAQLAALDEYKKRNLEKYPEIFDNINSKIPAMIAQQRAAGRADQEVEILKRMKDHKAEPPKGGMTGKFFKKNDRKLNSLIKATTNDFKKGEYAMLRQANDQYRKIIFNAQMYAASGAGTYEKAVDMATKDFLKTGITSIEYKDGSRHTMKEYSEMCIQTASKRAYLTGEGEKRKEWGMHLVIMNKRGNACPLCAKWAGKVLIDDVWSGGSREDGDYPLMSEAIAAGLYHPRCRDIHTTYFGDPIKKSDTYSKEEQKELAKDYNLENKARYAENMAGKYDRMAQYSLAEDNQRMYGVMANVWDNRKKDLKKHIEMTDNNYSGAPKKWKDNISEEERNDIKAVNPNYDKSTIVISDEEKRAFSENCVNCVIAYDLRKRGYDVIAKSRLECDVSRKTDKLWENINHRIVSNNLEEIINYVKSEENKSRFLLGMKGEVGGHAVIIENIDGEAIIIDVQRAIEYNDIKELEEIYVKFECWRIDNLNVSQTGYNACKER